MGSALLFQTLASCGSKKGKMLETSQHRGVDSSGIGIVPLRRGKGGALLLFRRLKIKCGHLVASLSTLTASSEPLDI